MAHQETLQLHCSSVGSSEPRTIALATDSTRGTDRGFGEQEAEQAGLSPNVARSTIPPNTYWLRYSRHFLAREPIPRRRFEIDASLFGSEGRIGLSACGRSSRALNTEFDRIFGEYVFF